MILCTLGLWWPAVLCAQETATPPALGDPTADAGQFDHRLRLLEEQNQRLSQEVWRLEEQLHHQSCPAPAPGFAEVCLSEQTGQGYRVTYDNGFLIAPRDLQTTPFTLKINSQNMVRYSAFGRDETFWTDSAGNQQPIENNNSFQIPRGRLIFSGTAWLPQLSYLLSIDYNTVTSNPIGFRAYELSYRFNRAIAISAGLGKVPGSREWLESAFAPLEGPDRSMATTFFRPSLSQGVWLTGEPLDDLHYHVMLSNGFNTLNLRPNQLNTRSCFSGSTWWEPWGEFGRGYSDLQSHDEPVVRFGGGYTFARGQGDQTDASAVENSLTRLSDGTLIGQPGALAPGVSVISYDLGLAAFDAAIKYRGLSLSTEFYAQNISALDATGPLPVSSIQAYGGFVQGGCFILPGQLQLYSRTSYVTGKYGTGHEIGGGVNWFILPRQSNLRFTFDATWLESSPANQNRTGYAAGQTGLLLRTQFTAVY